MSAETYTAESLESAFSGICNDIRVIEMRSKITADFHLFETGANFRSSMVVPKDGSLCPEVILRFPNVSGTTEAAVEMEYTLFAAESNAPGSATVRVQPRRNGSFAPHIVLTDVPVDEALAYARKAKRLYRG